MKIGKQFAALGLCLAVLWASRFAPNSCEGLHDIHAEWGPSWIAILGSGFLLTVFLYLLVYDLVAFVTYRLGWERRFDHLEVYPGDPPTSAQPISLKTKLLLFYPLDLAAVIFFLLPFWTKVAYCS
jgi:hypothetical protein